MKRYFIVLGDKTTAGGVVIQGEESCTNHGKPLAYHGAQVYCHACKTTGYICNIPPYRPMVLRGKQVALENDICLCKCEPPPRLIASQNTSSMSFDSGELAAMGYTSNGTRILQAAADALYDEQFTLTDSVGTPLPNTYYTIIRPGDVLHGTTDSQGRTARYQTNGAQHISIHLGHRQEA
ncbi:putative Zn-binding protein involved in type VI secretion [Paraburkholderia sp. RAU2J]|uniref:PAAR domain-containing protein n=1 Tax=Paraburkholderia sp. RAU2J TaxID=1938810 RepID=UPI000EACFD14|nr:PAAR domain-containing protein [Paraburkholderia sp. RAU2J]RKT26453.1 putative Zn-binding protein involved in type VI secretion [Paraburkholderia sp. RAU2J]